MSRLPFLILTFLVFLPVGGLLAEYRIGVIASLSGKGSIRGEGARMGIELAKERFEKANPGTKLKLFYQDVPLDKPSRAPAAFSHLVSVNKVDGIIGPMGSTITQSVKSFPDRYNIPTISHTSSATGVTDGQSNLLRLWPTASGYLNIIKKEIGRRGAKRIGIITSQSDNTVDLGDLLTNWISSQDGELSVVGDHLVPVEVTDFRTVLLKLSKDGADLIFLNLFEGQIGIAATQGRDLGLSVPYITNAVMSDLELEYGKAALEGVRFPRFIGYGEGEEAQFQKRFGKTPGNSESAAAAHDGLVALLETLEKVGTEPEKVSTHLKSGGGFSGLSGSFSFDKKGNGVLGLSTMEVREGKIIKVGSK